MNRYFSAAPANDNASHASDAAFWIIGRGGTDEDDVDTHIVFGTAEQVKEHLVEIIKTDIDTHISEDECFEYGTENVDELEDFNCKTKFYGSVTFSNSHIDYTATLVKAVKML
jgi:hypothetical protein